MKQQPSTVYVLNEQTGVWSRPSYQSISYSDGDESERALFDIITHTSDVSVLSSELKKQCTDWPKLYHLASARANILRPLSKWLKGKRVLEIGAGCGAITRGLGEWGAKVTALEGSMRRATIARARTRDLTNVCVLAETFSDFECTQRYDVVTLIGVLEYASLFVDGPKADQAMLKKARSLLKEDGLLVVAIENQLGLKYFAGFPEDHKGIVGYGIENRYQPREVKTYGRLALTRLLESCDFKERKFFAAFPDYKLPSVIIGEDGFRIQAFDVASLIGATARQDPQMPAYLSFDPERTWPLLCDNQIALDLANSFLVIAGNQHTTNLPGIREFAWHYNTNRRTEFTKSAIFFQNTHGDIEINREKLRDSDSLVITHNQLSNSIVANESYIQGTSLHERFVRVLSQDGWSDSDIQDQFEEYFDALGTILDSRIETAAIEHHTIPGKYIDAIPQNIIQTSEGFWKTFDLEWQWHQPLTVSYLVFRTLLSVMGTINRIGLHKKIDFKNRLHLIQHVYSLMGVDKAESLVSIHCKLEESFQSLSSGVGEPPLDLEKLLKAWPCRPHKIWEHAQSLQKQLQDADTFLHAAEDTKKKLHDEISRLTAERNLIAKHLAEHSHQITQLSLVVRDRDQFIRMVTGSTSWKLTKPVRYVGRKLSSLRPRRAEVKIDTQSSFSLIKSHLMHRPSSLCICIHAFHPEILEELSEKLSCIGVPARALITTTQEKYNDILQISKNWGIPSEILIFENRGRDILPFLLSLSKVRADEVILKIHTKKSSHRADGDVWRNDLVSKLLDPDMIRQTIAAFRNDYRLGMVIPKGHILSVHEFIGHNRDKFDAICNRFIPGYASLTEPLFAGGSMFFARTHALMPIARLCGDSADYELEHGQIDGTRAHAVERIFGVAVQAQGFRISSTADLNHPAQLDANTIHTEPVLRK